MQYLIFHENVAILRMVLLCLDGLVGVCNGRSLADHVTGLAGLIRKCGGGVEALLSRLGVARQRQRSSSAHKVLDEADERFFKLSCNNSRLSSSSHKQRKAKETLMQLEDAFALLNQLCVLSWREHPKRRGGPFCPTVDPHDWSVLVISLHFSPCALTAQRLLRLPDAFTAPLPGGSLPLLPWLPKDLFNCPAFPLTRRLILYHNIFDFLSLPSRRHSSELNIANLTHPRCQEQLPTCRSSSRL